MNGPDRLTDRKQLLHNRARATAMEAPAMFLLEDAALELKERLNEVNRAFTQPAIVTGFPDFWADFLPDVKIIPDDELLDLEPQAHDLIVHAMSLHWADDPVGQMIQCRRALKPDGLFIATLFGGQTLQELRVAMAEAEVAIMGGLSPRIAPMAEIRDLGALLQRAGFALPVADNLTQNVTYRDAVSLMRDLRAMGEGNAMNRRLREPSKQSLFRTISQIYAEHFPANDNRIKATFDIITLTGWAPDDSQQQPLRPGSAQQSLANALNTTEINIPD
ncbi:methyltransferase domain-containing protein [Halocynthiibacter styelae]|uniref:Methyltransferase domain-containing protein n=1 Tax=Halocynthiibacter styelae TaxID=2761955 RepID=A0A8J7IDP3_9RHOB|nr:methyltransferase domain-containing protein [Paenihalocynthiibacter styelae]MBI1493964.1 methyltransferase domain-containing protein [Paenihalocynthiibacter styelae]